MYTIASHPEVMSHVPSRWECKHICDYPNLELSSTALAPLLSYDVFLFLVEQGCSGQTAWH